MFPGLWLKTMDQRLCLGTTGCVDRGQTSDSNHLIKIPPGEYAPLVEYWPLKSLIQLEKFDPFSK